MNTISAELTVQQIVARFVACAICVGYCRDSGRNGLADDIQNDIGKLALLLQKSDQSWIESLRVIALARDGDPWSRYFAAISISRVDVATAIPLLEELSTTGDGLARAASIVALFQAKKQV